MTVAWNRRLFNSILVQFSISTTPENVRKPKVFLTFSWGIEIEHWAKIGYNNLVFRAIKKIALAPHNFAGNFYLI